VRNNDSLRTPSGAKDALEEESESLVVDESYTADSKYSLRESRCASKKPIVRRAPSSCAAIQSPTSSISSSGGVGMSL